jgi:hypothetical protein
MSVPITVHIVYFLGIIYGFFDENWF